MVITIAYVLFLIGLLAYTIYSGNRQHAAWKEHVATCGKSPAVKLESVPK